MPTSQRRQCNSTTPTCAISSTLTATRQRLTALVHSNRQLASGPRSLDRPIELRLLYPHLRIQRHRRRSDLSSHRRDHDPATSGARPRHPWDDKRLLLTGRNETRYSIDDLHRFLLLVDRVRPPQDQFPPPTRRALSHPVPVRTSNRAARDHRLSCYRRKLGLSLGMVGVPLLRFGSHIP